jgi:hypothetical protein
MADGGLMFRDRSSDISLRAWVCIANCLLNLLRTSDISPEFGFAVGGSRTKLV